MPQTQTATVFMNPADATFFNYLQELRLSFEAKYNKSPEYLLLHPIDHIRLTRELKDYFGKMLYAVPCIMSPLIPEHSPKFVIS